MWQGLVDAGTAGSSFDARDVHPRVRLAMRVIENEQQVVPSAKVLAKRVGMSVAHFSRQFAAQLGEGSSAYGRRIRLDHSVNRLRYDPASVGEVAQDFGYTSHAAFTRAFTEQFGSAPRDYMANVASMRPTERTPLPGSVQLVRREPMRLAARRFFGGDTLTWWRQFARDLPPAQRQAGVFVGLSYDDPRVTPDRHQRYDCCVLLDNDSWHPAMAKAGLDLIELPGGLHGEVAATGAHGSLRSLVTSLFADWLPNRPALAPEGDPFPIVFGAIPIDELAEGRVAIRVRERTDEQNPNASTLDRL